MEKLRKRKRKPHDYAIYQEDPVGYCKKVLQVELTPKQEEAARKIRQPPYKVLCRAGSAVGKSFLEACLLNWAYDCFDPGVSLQTAPTDRQVKDIVWKEVRRTRRKRPNGAKDFPGPK